ncbi:uncharacterized protein LOC130632706 [Hydractinia symbiolongicarpus]|uniref:uncharacterized protein LOC130632706 n=1 Tax=Hydractinia symbiolongicarpus TaxID=13093 RepID=UPI00254CB0D4|nr:uncharacterized protein LOC130632706 [Hydractinia symbiolongicarpus]
MAYKLVACILAVAFAFIPETIAQDVSTTMEPMMYTKPMDSQLNCTNIPNVPQRPTADDIDQAVVASNRVIRATILFLSSNTTEGVRLRVRTINRVLALLTDLLQSLIRRIRIVNRRLNCGLVTTLAQATRLEAINDRDTRSVRSLRDLRRRLRELRERLQKLN